MNSPNPTKFLKNWMEVTVRHELFLSMVDGKVSQFLTNTKSWSTCTICKFKLTQMNDLKNITARPGDKDSLRDVYTSCLTLMCGNDVYIISYNLEFKRWSVTRPEYKDLKNIKNSSFKNVLEVIVTMAIRLESFFKIHHIQLKLKEWMKI